MECDICEGLREGFFICPKCGRNVFDFDYMKNLDMMEKKYGTSDFLELSKEKLTFAEIITIYSFIEREGHHCGDTLTSERCASDGTYFNLRKRLDKIKKEVEMIDFSGKIMHDLTKLEKKFHEFIKKDEFYKDFEIRITEDLLNQQEALYIPFGWMTYFLVLEDEKPVLYVREISRMDLNTICFVYEDRYERYDISMGSHKDVRRKYNQHRRNVRRYRKLNGIPKAKDR